MPVPVPVVDNIEDLNFDLIIVNDVSNNSAPTQRDRIEEEIDDFLNEKTTEKLETLDRFPHIKKVFMKFNCIRSSEAICERLFSYAGKQSA